MRLEYSRFSDIAKCMTNELTYKERLQKLAQKAEVFKALAHPTRIFILEKLLERERERERDVTELTAMLGVEMPTVSRHLSVLKTVGLIASRKEGSNVYHRILRECVKKTMECAEWKK